MLNILWLFVPVIGWLALFGYTITIVKHFIKGDFRKLPKMKFGEHLGLGFFMFLKSIPFMVVYGFLNFILTRSPTAGFFANLFIAIFFVPILTVNFFNKETVASYFEFRKLGAVFNNLWEYIIVMLKSLALGLIFLLMFLILVGIPANSFTKNIFIADFYRRRVKK